MSHQPQPAATPHEPTADSSGRADAYDNLPGVIRAGVSREAWLWLSDAEKSRYIQNETEPEA